MKDEKKKIIMTTVVTLLVLLSVFAIVPASVLAATPASNSGSVSAGAPVGTVTLSPANGAFPGQIVYYKWTGVPTNLVPPVKVTVYINGAVYSSQIATYDSANGVLTGTFIMPNDQPGTVFDLSFSYMDSSKNYGTQTVNGYGTVYVGLSPDGNVTDQLYDYPASGTAHFSGNTSLGGWTVGSITSDDEMSSGSSVWTMNVTNQLIPTAYPLYNDTPSQLQSVDINAEAAYVSQVNFTEIEIAHNTTVNATTVDEGQAILSLPSSDVVPSTFTFNTAGDTITKITTEFYVNTTVSGSLVSFKFTGIYAAPITAPGAYTMPGTFVAVAPATLAAMTGQFSASYDIHDFGFDGTNYYVNYTLSITFSGSYSYVSVNAQYLTTTYVNNTGTTATFTNTTTVNLQAGYSFTSKYVGLANPGINAIYKFSFQNGSYYINGTQFSFADYKTIDVLNGIPTLYFNETLNMLGFNRTVTGALNMTITTNYFVQGVYAIAPAVWNFTMNFTFALQSDDGMITVTGHSYPITQDFELTAIVTPTLDFGNWNQIFAPTLNATLQTYYGWPKINYVTFGETSVTFTYCEQEATLTVGESKIPVDMIIDPATVGNSYLFNGTRVISGLNETLEYGIYNGATDMQLNVIVNAVEPVIYGVTNTGYYNVTYYGTLHANDTIGAIVFEGTTDASTVNTTVGTIPTDYMDEVAHEYTLNLYEIGWYLNSAEFTATVTVGYDGYSGTLTFNGAGNGTVNTLLTDGALFEIDGLVTGLAGFANNSMGGWFNATVTVIACYALYGGVFNGYYQFDTEFNIKKNATDYPYFEGSFSTKTTDDMIESTLPYAEIYVLNSDSSYNEYITLEDYMQYVNITGATLTGTNSFQWDAYGISLTYKWNVGPFDITPNANNYWSEYFSGVSTVVTGVPELDYNNTNVYMRVIVGKPLQNVSLFPVMSSYLSVYIRGDIEPSIMNYVYYEFYSGTYNSTSILLNLQNGGVNSFDAMLSGWQDHYIKLQKYDITFYGTLGGITFTTSSISVNNVGTYFVMGTANSVYGSGTVTGYVNIYQHTPYVSAYSGRGYNDLVIEAELQVHTYLSNGTQAYISVNLPQVLVYSPATQYFSWKVSNVPYTYTSVVETVNQGMYEFGNYKLEQGSGAMVVTLSDDQIATIVTQLGDVVNISLAQLDAKIVGLWNTANETYALLNTAYGQMTATLQAIDGKITDIQNGIATIQTDLGNIQTSLNNLDAKITKLQGDVATIQTTLGTVNVKLDALNATVVSNAKGISDLKGSVVEIQTTLGTIKGTVTDIKDGVATIQTDLGTVQTDVNNIKTNTANTANSVNTTLYWQIGVLILVIITLALVAYVIVQVNKIAKKSEVKEEKVEEETTEEE